MAARWTTQAFIDVVREPDVVDEVRDGGADERPDDRDPRVAPVGVALAGDRQQEVRDARAEVAGGVDRVAGRAAERKADDQDQERDGQRAEVRRGRLSGWPKVKMTNISTNVPMISLTRFHGVMCGSRGPC